MHRSCTSIWCDLFRNLSKNGALGVVPKEVCQCFQNGGEIKVLMPKKVGKPLGKPTERKFDERMGKIRIFV